MWHKLEKRGEEEEVKWDAAINILWLTPPQICWLINLFKLVAVSIIWNITIHKPKLFQSISFHRKLWTVRCTQIEFCFLKETPSKNRKIWRKNSELGKPSGKSLLCKILLKHRKNCECCPVWLLIVRSQWLSWIRVLNCLKFHTSSQAMSWSLCLSVSLSSVRLCNL